MIGYKVATEKIDLADELEEEFAKDVRGVMTDAAEIYLDEAHKVIEQTGPNAPALPGQTPATVTGNLKKMTKRLPTRVRSRSRHASSGIVYAPHAHLVEYGHTNADGTRTLPRPFIDRAAQAAEPKIEALMREKLG